MDKIVYVIDSLHYTGGAERIITEKANYLASRFGYQVYVVTCYQDAATQPNAYPLLPQVTQVNLSIPFFSQYRVGYPRRLWVKWQLSRMEKQRLADAVSRIDPDVIVGLGYFNAHVVCTLKCRAAKVVESHEARFFSMAGHGEGNHLAARYYKKLRQYWHQRRVERGADVVVALTNGDAHEWRKARRVAVIPNFSVMEVTALSDGHNRQVLAVGRLEWQKGYDRLIEAWQRVARRHPDWQLVIRGEGSLRQALADQIARAGLSNVAIKPFTSAISADYAQSAIVVLASRYEGFSLVLLEAMRHGVPCVAFDCPFGPADVLADGTCGYVVENGNVDLLADKICELIDDDALRRRFAEAALQQAQKFNTDAIMQQWRRLFTDIRPT